jgi:glycosyltransferase involved in cell wall biosynthesis
MNVLLVSHCDFRGNSALHVFNIAVELERSGYSPTICVPENSASVDDLGRPSFPIQTFDEVRLEGTAFTNGHGPDLVHAFTPRELVRDVTDQITLRYGCPYIVHLEDNEEVILTDALGGAAFEVVRGLPQPLLDGMVLRHHSHPIRARAFLERAAGMTAVIETLLDFGPDDMPAQVIWPGFDRSILSAKDDSSRVRASLDLRPDDVVLAYTGDIHPSNLGEVRSLYVAVALLRRAGYQARLVKTGWNKVDMSWAEELSLGDAVIDLGFVSRRRLGELLSIADVLVQPGGPSRFNDFRFPSKLPDFLASGKPVILPRTNIGLHLRDGEDALLLERGHAVEIFEKVVRVVEDKALARRLGENGRAFAFERLRWDETVKSLVELYSGVSNGRAEQRIAVSAAAGARAPEPPVKLLAFYLPQFHSIPENDEWWGEGFTEWTNVRKARPLFDGHHQPQLPTELGFYDLRVPEVLEAQADLAREYGIYGFCFYYYWFNGRRVLERPIDEMLERGLPTFPFCFCWANENWTRRWDGAEHDVLLRQEYDGDWADRFIMDVLPALLDKRYVRVREAPLLLVYRANVIPQAAHVIQRWREVAQREAGVELHLAAVQTFGLIDPTEYGFDAAVEFPPHTERFAAGRSGIRGLVPEFDGYLEDYEEVMRNQLAKPLPPYHWYRGAMPAWDNTARRGHHAHVIVNTSPAKYRLWLRKLVLQTLVRSDVQEPLVFLNAWNEWGEGNHLEPDQWYGREWLEATRSALADGVRQSYVSLGFSMTQSQAAAYLNSALPPP